MIVIIIVKKYLNGTHKNEKEGASEKYLGENWIARIKDDWKKLEWGESHRMCGPNYDSNYITNYYIDRG